MSPWNCSNGSKILAAVAGPTPLGLVLPRRVMAGGAGDAAAIAAGGYSSLTPTEPTTASTYLVSVAQIGGAGAANPHARSNRRGAGSCSAPTTISLWSRDRPASA